MMHPRNKDTYATASPTSVQVNDSPRFYQVVHFAIGLSNSINVAAMKHSFSNSIMLRLPRFSSLLVKQDSRRHYWLPTQVHIDQHFTVIRRHPRPDHDDDPRDAINGYLAELATAPPLSPDKPLWEIHVLLHLTCVVLRIHHALGDGTSLTSLINHIGGGRPPPSPRLRSNVNVNSGYFRNAWLSTVFSVESMLNFCLVRDKKTVLHHNNRHLQKLPHKIATARFNLADINLVKQAIPDATVNDAICGIIWHGFLMYINDRPTIGMKEGQQITGVVMANLRTPLGLRDVSKSMQENTLESWWGNKFRIFRLPLYYTKKMENPLDCVRKAKFILDRKKRSAEPRFSIFLRNTTLRLFGVDV